MTERNRERDAQAEFSRRLADPKFREALAGKGGAHQDVVIALDETPIRDVLARVFARCRPPALVAIRREREAQGFVFVVFAPAVGPHRRGVPPFPVEREKLHPDASIGAIYDSLRMSPNGLTFELTDELAYDIEPVGA